MTSENRVKHSWPAECLYFLGILDSVDSAYRSLNDRCVGLIRPSFQIFSIYDAAVNGYFSR